MKLVGAHALFAGTQQMIGKQPFAQGNVAVSEDRADRDGKLTPAPAALPYTLANMLALLGRLWLQAVSVAHFATVRADRAIGQRSFSKNSRALSSSLKC